MIDLYEKDWIAFQGAKLDCFGKLVVDRTLWGLDWLEEAFPSLVSNMKKLGTIKMGQIR